MPEPSVTAAQKTAGRAPGQLNARRSIGAAMNELAAAFRDAGIDTPRRDARLLIAHATNMSTTQIVGHPEFSLSSEADEVLLESRARRLRREPVSRIVSEREFWGHGFKISPAVLDPRADSETVVEAVLEIVCKEGLSDAPIRLLDIGTGSGCLLLALLQELPHAFGIGSDVCQAALSVARENAVRFGLQQRATFVCVDALDALSGPFDIVVSNPPYIRTDDIADLAPEVGSYDPRRALDGGSDGLDVYRRIVSRLADVIQEGWVMLEVGIGQSGEVADLLAATGFIADASDARVYLDLAGRVRCVAAKARNRA